MTLADYRFMGQEDIRAIADDVDVSTLFYQSTRKLCPAMPAIQMCPESFFCQVVALQLTSHTRATHAIVLQPEVWRAWVFMSLMSINSGL